MMMPKGFSNGQYVDRFRLRDKLYQEDAVTMKGVAILNNFPAADVVEVRHGRWLSMDGDNTTVSLDEFGCPTDSCRCSECGDWLTASDEYSVRGRYCPNCGAKMGGGQDDV